MRIDNKLTQSDKGKSRTRIRFAYLPARLTNGDRIWLDTYIHIEHVEGDSPLLFWVTDNKSLFRVGDED